MFCGKIDLRMVGIMKKEKEQYLSNLFKLALIFIFTILVVLGIRKWYLNGLEIELATPVIAEVLHQEIKKNEVYTYISENDPAILYFESSSDSSCRKLEKNLLSFIRDNSLEDIIVYMNLDDEDVSKFFSDFKEYFGYKKELVSVPTFVYMEDGKVKQVLTGKLDKAKVEEFFREIGVIL